MAPVASLIFHPPEVFDASAARKKGPRSWLGDWFFRNFYRMPSEGRCSAKLTQRCFLMARNPITGHNQYHNPHANPQTSGFPSGLGHCGTRE